MRLGLDRIVQNLVLPFLAPTPRQRHEVSVREGSRIPGRKTILPKPSLMLPTRYQSMVSLVVV